MNSKRRMVIKDIILKIKNIINEIEKIKEEEEFSMDSLPLSLQDSEKYTTFEDNIEILEEIESNFNSIIDELETL